MSHFPKKNIFIFWSSCKVAGAHTFYIWRSGGVRGSNLTLHILYIVSNN